MSSLLLTLGHGSSAILVHEGRVVCGFENERLTAIKSDSQFPADAINKICDLYPKYEVTDVFVSHWFMSPELPAASGKWDGPFIRNKFPKASVHTLRDDFTHHDAHIVSAKVFAGHEFLKLKPYGLVCDGFGTCGEVISLYGPSSSQHDADVTMRLFGFNLSLGLMYQYATSYLGLKPHQDEYKLLGYATQLDRVDFSSSYDESSVKQKMTRFGKQAAREALMGVNSGYDPMVSIGALPKTTKLWYDALDTVCKDVLQAPIRLDHQRIVVAALVQTTLECVISEMIDVYDIKHLVVSGGVFMNVALNNMICRKLQAKGGQLCIMPLCGDSGAALGVYDNYATDLTWPEDLFWGHRSFLLEDYARAEAAGIVVADMGAQLIKTIKALLRCDYIVNIVQGSMEYGPRALGHTSTVALPTRKNVAYINECNDRSTVMPMAGVCRSVDISNYHALADCVHKSLEYMTCALDFQDHKAQDVKGAAHNDRDRSVFTGRTQAVRESHPSIFQAILSDDMPMVINTSFNPHGKPIVYSIDDIIGAHKYMIGNDIENRVFTFLIK